MFETQIEIKTTDGVCDAVLFAPTADKKYPGVLVLPDIFGVRPASKNWAARIAAEGYTALLVNAFYRTGKYPLFDHSLEGDARTKRLGELAGPLTPDAIERDAIAYVDCLASQKFARQAPFAVCGTCFTGALALRTAAALPDKIAAVASFHGGRLYTDQPTSPHLLLPRVSSKTHLYFGHASEDQSMPKEVIEKFEQALAAWGGKYESETYAAQHGWTMSDSAKYAAVQAERAFGKLRVLLKETLG